MANIDALRQEVSRVLSEKIVDVVLGFEAGSLPTRNQPVFIHKAKESKRLVDNGFGANNLAALLSQRPKDEKIGVICRGCESRAIRALTIEQQLKRENLYLIGVPCQGIIDWRALERAVDGDILAVAEVGEDLLVTLKDGEKKLARAEVLHSACRNCRQPDPVGTDVLIGELPEREGLPQRSPDVAAFLGKDANERYAIFSEEAERCIRCYACREACPMCYCTECFVDHITPRWSESMVSRGGTQAWHIIRAFHQTGRCVSCGACERACPMEIKMEYITDRLNEDMQDMYGFEVGANDSDQPPFAAFSLDDRNRFKE